MYHISVIHKRPWAIFSLCQTAIFLGNFAFKINWEFGHGWKESAVYFDPTLCLENSIVLEAAFGEKTQARKEQILVSELEETFSDEKTQGQTCSKNQPPNLKHACHSGCFHLALRPS